MKGSQTAQIVTAVSVTETQVQLVQARWTGKGIPKLLGMKSRQVKDASEVALASALKELAGSLPESSREVVGLLSKREILTRYLTLPSDKLDELQGMAFYQLEGVLPYPVDECVTSVKVVGPAGEATRVLVAAAHRPTVERLVRICAQAGLDLIEIAVSSEAIGQWHKACSLGGEKLPAGAWLSAELTSEGMDIGVLDQGSLIYMRHVPGLLGSVTDMAGRLQETIQAYQRERIGPQVAHATVSGWLEGRGATVEQLEHLLELPVRRVDPLESSPFRESLAVTVKEFAPEISFTELLGVVAAPRLLELDLLPVETRLHQKHQLLVHRVGRVVLLVAIWAALACVWAGARIGGTGWQLKQAQYQIQSLQPRVNRIQWSFGSIRALAAARQAYALELSLLTEAVRTLEPEMTLQFFGLEANKGLTLRGLAPDLGHVTRFAITLREQAVWDRVFLRSAKTREKQEGEIVEFELQLQPSGIAP